MEREEERGRWKRNKLQKLIEGGTGGRGGGSRDGEERSVLRLSLSVRATRLAVATTRRSIDVATSVVAHAHTHIYTPILSISLSLFFLVFIPPHLSPASPLRTRGWNYWDRALPGAADTERGVRGARAPLAADQRRPCARFPFLHSSPATSWPFIQQDPCSRPTLSFS